MNKISANELETTFGKVSATYRSAIIIMPNMLHRILLSGSFYLLFYELQRRIDACRTGWQLYRHLFCIWLLWAGRTLQKHSIKKLSSVLKFQVPLNESLDCYVVHGPPSK